MSKLLGDRKLCHPRDVSVESRTVRAQHHSPSLTSKQINQQSLFLYLQHAKLAHKIQNKKKEKKTCFPPPGGCLIDLRFLRANCKTASTLRLLLSLMNTSNPTFICVGSRLIEFCPRLFHACGFPLPQLVHSSFLTFFPLPKPNFPKTLFTLESAVLSWVEATA